MEINKNFIPQKPSDSKKISKSTSSKKTSKNENSPIITQSKDNILINQQNNLSITQTKINGIETIKKSLDDSPQKTNEIIREVIDKNLFHNKKVLKDYETELTNTPAKELAPKIDKILNSLQEQRENIIYEIDKSEVKEQNVQSLESWNTQLNPEELLHQITDSLEAQGNLFKNIPTERIADLLSE